MQFTIRAIGLATFCVGVCFGAFGLARSATPSVDRPAIVPSLLFVSAILALCAAAIALFKDSPASGKPVRAKAIIGALAAWNVIAYVVVLAYPHTIGQLVVVSDERLFGDIHAGFASFARIEMFVGYFSVTLPAAVVGLWLFGAISHRLWKWRQAAMIIVVWEIMVILVLAGSYESGFPYQLNQVGWAIFGVPGNVYSFTNLGLHRIIAWLVETTPVTWTSLWLYSRLA
jgi:hypothetical protein